MNRKCENGQIFANCSPRRLNFTLRTLGFPFPLCDATHCDRTIIALKSIIRCGLFRALRQRAPKSERPTSSPANPLAYANAFAPLAYKPSLLGYLINKRNKFVHFPIRCAGLGVEISFLRSAAARAPQLRPLLPLSCIIYSRARIHTHFLRIIVNLAAFFMECNPSDCSSALPTDF